MCFAQFDEILAYAMCLRVFDPFLTARRVQYQISLHGRETLLLLLLFNSEFEKR